MKNRLATEKTHNHIRLDVDRCVCCGDCAAICPVLVYRRRTPPCQAACPIGTEVESYVSLVAQGKFSEALEVNRRVNPLPLVCGRVCNHPCESMCYRGTIDDAVAICSLKRFVGDDELTSGKRSPITRQAGIRPESVAVVGSGPAGLAAAHSLAHIGYGVTVFEAENVPGGMLHWGIPDFRLPKDIVAREIEDIKALGVEIRTGVTVGGSPGIEDLKHDGFNAVLLAIGVQQCRLLGIPGEAGTGVFHCLQLMKKIAAGERAEIGRNVVVVGGGNVAIDGARAVKRLGAETVRVVCVESREKMPAGSREVVEAEEEGIIVMPSRQCLKIIRKSGAVKAVECIELASMTFVEGKLITEVLPGTGHTIAADTVMLAIGQSPDVSGISGLKPGDVGRGGRLHVDSVTGSASQPWLFAAGDAVSGPSSVVEAMASGKKAALAIDAFLTGNTLSETGKLESLEPMVEVIAGDIARKARQEGPRLDSKARITTFKEVELGYSGEQAVAEARRCLGCGVFGVVDLASCCSSTCRLCSDNCWQRALTITRDGTPAPSLKRVKSRR